jgi:hypothetical protein
MSEVEMGFVVSLGVLRNVLRGLNIRGRRWWISSDPHDAAEDGYISVAHGTIGAYDRLNTLHFRVPVIGNAGSKFTDRLILMFDPSTTTAVEPGYYLHDGRILEDPVEDLTSFYEPIEEALIARLREPA